MFITVDGSNAPEKHRDALVSLAVRRAAPFSDADFGVAWQADGRASAWYWSRSRIADLLAERRISAPRIQFAPEALYAGEPRSDGTELLTMHEGVEGRVWRNGAVVGSRWWPAEPAPKDWHTFLRSHGLSANDPPAATPTVDILPRRPWGGRPGRMERGVRLSTVDAYRPAAALGLAAVILLVASFQTGSIVRSHVEAWQSARAAEDLDEPLKRILNARETADRNVAELERLLDLRQGPSVLTVMAEVGRLLPRRDIQLRHWNQPTPDQLELTLSAADADPQQIVETWEASTVFDNVTTDVVGRSGEIIVRARIAADVESGE
ncbi:hypothetical protein [Luteimonas deserti]|uniref:Uncharacterized protein n=1 Tax=Luteimonas deserti TaxID=2752306 RepID=A0A7Z0QSJ8_9GAMM|nr:hypothetical protein [Luteimonas deserti]NYZ62245.1 hypothetical protein [Luteimonas deserti]